MAPKSILKNVTIEGKKNSVRFVDALENAAKKSSKELDVPEYHYKMSEEELRNMLATGEEQAERGEGISDDEFFAEIKQELI